MILKEFSIINKHGRNIVQYEVQCDVCNTIFVRYKRHLNTHSCSVGCRKIIQEKALKVLCANCGKILSKSPSRLRKSKSEKYFCNLKCRKDGQRHIPELYGTDFKFSGNSYRSHALSIYGKVCQLCGFNKNESALEVHHKDKNRNNNTITNLIVLCANCHKIIHSGIT